MPKVLKRCKGLLLVIMLASVSVRVFTGAAEAQVNFTSLIIQQYKTLSGDIDYESILHGVVASNPTDASSIPDNLKTFATYKKYLAPESATHIPNSPSHIPPKFVDIGGNLVSLFSQKVVYQPKSHSPPAVMSAFSHTHMTSAVDSANLENYFGKIAIDNSTGEFRSLKL